MSLGKTIGWCQTLYEAKGPELILYGRALGLSHAEAEDVLQETFLALMQLHQAPERPEHYCVRAFRNRALNYRRSLWRRLTRELESRRWFEPAAGEHPLEREAIASLARLPREQQEVVVLKIWHEYTFEEIADLLGIPANTAAGRYRYGIQKIRLALKGTEDERDQRIGEAFAFVGATPPLTKA